MGSTAWPISFGDLLVMVVNGIDNATYCMHVNCMQMKLVINPRRMREGYGSCFVCVSVCLSVTALAATYLVCMSKLRHHRVPCRLLKVFIAWISLKIVCSGDTA